MLRKALNRIIDSFNGQDREENVLPYTEKQKLTLSETADLIHSIFSRNGEIQERLLKARSGVLSEALYIEKEIVRILNDQNKQVIGMSTEEAARLIYSKNWGLGVCEKYNRDPLVDEIRVNRPDQIFIVKQGKPYRVPEAFENEQEVESVIKRMFMDDVGAFLDKSNPTVESVRKDGSRLTATCPPVTDTWTFVLRKHGTFYPTKENYLRTETMDKKCWDMLTLLAKGRASIIISGNVGAGKTTLMRALVGQLHDDLRIICIGKDSELRLSAHYPDKDIIEMEEHAQVGADMANLFTKILRYSPDLIITEEFRSAEETLQAIRACNRGLPGSMASAHFGSAEEAVEGAGLMLIEQGLNLNLEMAKLKVARAFNIVVQLYSDTVSGKKKLISITEIHVDKEKNITFRDLIRWTPSGSNYMGKGTWEMIDYPSNELIAHLLKNVNEEDLGVVGWTLPPIRTL